MWSTVTVMRRIKYLQEADWSIFDSNMVICMLRKPSLTNRQNTCMMWQWAQNDWTTWLKFSGVHLTDDIETVSAFCQLFGLWFSASNVLDLWDEAMKTWTLVSNCHMLESDDVCLPATWMPRAVWQMCLMLTYHGGTQMDCRRSCHVEYE